MERPAAHRYDAGELARPLVVRRQSHQPVDPGARRSCQFQGFDLLGRRDARAAEHHDRRADAGLTQCLFRFRVFECKAQRAHLVRQKEGLVIDRKQVALRGALGAVVIGLHGALKGRKATGQAVRLDLDQ